MKPLRILLLNQCFYPDHVASAQFLTDLALGLAQAGHSVTAVASSRGYDNPEQRYPIHETWQGITIQRIWTPGLGKSAKWRRLVDFAAFWLNATLILLRLPRFDVTVCLTSPPLISSLGTLIAQLKGGAVIPWVMDLNPDEAVAAGWLKEGGWPERIMSTLQTWSFHRAARIVALDRFMARRLEKKGIPTDLIEVMPPWSREEVVHYDAAARHTFRAQHGIMDQFVVMYAGNHSPCHPLDPLLQAALKLASDARFHFMFIGGGSEFAKVQAFKAAHSLASITCLPYQPMDQLSGALSAADLQAVVVGEPFVGIVHPCKIYNILALGQPFLGIGPAECHLTDLARQLPDSRYALMTAPENVGGLVRALLTAAQERLPPSEQSRHLAAQYSQAVLRPRLIDLVERCATP